MAVKPLLKLEFSYENEIISELTVIIAAAGHSRRMGTDKILMPLMNKPVILHTLSAFEKCDAVKNIIVVANDENIREIQKICSDNNISKLTDVVLGGKERLNSVKNGLDRCFSKYVAVHDGARPLVTDEIIKMVLDEAVKYGGAIAGAPVKNTVKIIDKEGIEVDTPQRSLLFEAHTPQIFNTAQYKEAINIALKDTNTLYTDDASVFTMAKKQVKTVNTGYENIKITTAEDIILAEQILKRRMKI